MQLSKRNTRTGSEFQCGPLLMLSILAAVVGLFVLIGVFTHRHNTPEPRTSQPSGVSNLPKQ